MNLTTIEVEKLDALKLLHAPDGYQGRWCDVCLEGGSMDSERQDWPCDTAQLLYSPQEMYEIRRRREEADAVAYAEDQRKFRERAARERADADRLRRSDPEAYWRMVELAEMGWRTRKAVQSVWSKEIAFQSMPVLRYSRIAHRDGSVDEHLRTGRYAADDQA